ncbi:hypothetical protein LBMAG42_11670 [Deltaproteobacteria bacterium]|nr:hypothetical protein LBMAG42_11670 [Deltaproteobacteria bacterium]
MFDNVGRNRSQNAGRTVGSLLLSLTFNGTLLAFIAWMMVKAPEVVEELKDKLVAVDLAAPPPPPPPPPPPGGSKKKEKKEKVEVKEEVPVDPQVLQPDPPPVVEEEDDGVEGGVEGGVKDGVVGGVVGGVKDGVLGGQLGGTGNVKTVHWSEAQVKTRVKPRFPEAAQQLGLKEEKCITHIVIDTSGEPSDVTFKSCPELFKAAAREAALQWRWYPVMDNGQPTRAQFDINFIFKLND